MKQERKICINCLPCDYDRVGKICTHPKNYSIRIDLVNGDDIIYPRCKYMRTKYKYPILLGIGPKNLCGPEGKLWGSKNSS